MTPREKVLAACAVERSIHHEYRAGMEYENDRLLPIIEQLLSENANLVRALKRECSCSGEIDFVSQEPIECDACDARKENEAAMERIGK